MRGVISIVTCLVLLLTPAVPALGGGMVHDRVSQAVEAEGEGSASAHGHPTGGVRADDAAEPMSPPLGNCTGGDGVHCGSVAVLAARGEMLPDVTGYRALRLQANTPGPHRTPETEAPPPRV